MAFKVNNYRKEALYGIGTEIEQNIAESSDFNVTEILELSKNRLREIESRLSVFLPASSISILNRENGKSVFVDMDTCNVLNAAKICFEKSHGAFDVTSAPIVSLWRDYMKFDIQPPPGKIKKTLSKVDGSKVEVDRQRGSARLGKGQNVNLGGIGKGYAADEVKKIYKHYGVQSAFVNLGGNVLTIGSKIGGEPWVVGIQDPRAPRGNFVGAIKANDTSVVTSGDYERYFWADGRRCHHIIDTKTGFPSESGLMSVTVVCSDSIYADALSTAVFVLGFEKGLDLIEKSENTAAVFITVEKQVFIMRELKDLFLFDTNCTGYTYYYC
jgi:thiamine biosynthesis lipoprotein